MHPITFTILVVLGLLILLWAVTRPRRIRRRNQRDEQILSALEQTEGLSTFELHRCIGYMPGQLYADLSRLERKGVVGNRIEPREDDGPDRSIWFFIRRP